MSLDKKYLADLRASVCANIGAVPNQRAYEGSEWEARVIRCSRRLLSAIVFREMAQVTLDATESALLPLVGFYYTMFHAGVAILSVDHATPLADITYTGAQENGPGMTHKKLRALLKKLAERGVLDDDYNTELDAMKKLREYVNYVVGGGLPGEANIEALDEKGLYARVGTSLDAAVALVREIVSNVALDAATSGLDLMRRTIGDHFGDNLIHLYVPRRHRDRVWGYLKGHDITN